MRLSQTTRDIIKSTEVQALGADAMVRLFGSHVDDAQRGGDIDLLIETQRPIESRINAECKLAAQLFIKIGGRKVDGLIKVPDMQLQMAHQQALSNGVIL